MLKIGINGFGRIGRAILRNNLDKSRFEVVAINDINPDIKNMAYTVNYDTLYGPLDEKYQVDENYLYNNVSRIRVTHERHVNEVNWADANVDILIDASGVLDNVVRLPDAIKTWSVKRAIVTHAPAEVDFTMVLGANEGFLNIDNHNIIASSICDATAIGPVLTEIQKAYGIEMGSVTTLHPWLSYQNVLDGPASSWSVPGDIYHHYALGRGVEGNIIPKPTSAMSATCKVVPGVNEDMFISFSYRTPTAIVGSADITLLLGKDATKEDIISLFENVERNQKWQIIKNNLDPLVSLDFKRSEYSAIIDHRWTDIRNKRLLKLVLWYDNEWGYSCRVCDQVAYIEEKMSR